jgi:hypothetical protein
MARVEFTGQLRRFLPVEATHAPGDTVRAVLDAALAGNPRLRHYVLDEQGMLRKHVTVFVDGAQIRDRVGLSDAVGAGAEVYVLQALSGG